MSNNKKTKLSEDEKFYKDMNFMAKSITIGLPLLVLFVFIGALTSYSVLEAIISTAVIGAFMVYFLRLWVPIKFKNNEKNEN